MTNQALAYLAAGIASFGAVLGAGMGIGRLAAAALEGSARQPEAAGNLQGMMIIAAAFIEGVAIIALVVALLLIFVTGG